VVLFSVALAISLPEGARAYTPHAPILIEGDANFTAANGVTGGSGTPADPFLIEGWEINASAAVGVVLVNTIAHFVVRGVYVHSGGLGVGYDGIGLAWVANGAVENSTISQNLRGIMTYSSTNLTLAANSVQSNRMEGIRLFSSSNVTISDSVITLNSLEGILLSSSSNVIITNNVVWNNLNGISLRGATDITVISNSLSNNGDGIYLWSSWEVTIAANTAWRNSLGIYIDSSSNLTVSANNAFSNFAGIYIDSSYNLTLSANNASSNDIYGIVLSTSASATLDANTAASNFLYGISLLDSAGITVTGNNASNNKDGIHISGATNLTIASNNLSGNEKGIYLLSSGDARIRSNNVSRDLVGISLSSSTNVTISSNNVSENSNGISLSSSTNVTISSNNVSENMHGVYLDSSTRVTITANNATANAYGVYLYSSTFVSLAANSVTSNSLSGIYLYSSNNASLSGNVVSSGSVFGIRLSYSVDVAVFGNSVSNNKYGFVLGFSSNVVVYHNTLVGNEIQAGDQDGPENLWDEGYPSGGNYWSDYLGVDDCSGPAQDVCPDPDGIGDTPYIIDPDSQDRYPLMASPGTPAPPRLVAATLSGANDRDLDLNWQRSGDDGGVNGTTAYRILRAPSLSGPYVEIASVPADGSLTYTFTCGACGHVPGDTNLTFYRVQAVSATNRTADSNVAARYAKPLQPGTNLLSIPLEQADYAVQAVLRTFTHGTVRTYSATDAADPWKAFYPGRPGDLVQTSFGEALWVNAAAPGQYTLAGLVRTNPSFSLSSGWNLVVYAAFVNETLDQSLAGVPVTRVEAFDPSAGPHYLRVVPGVELLRTGEAYWVYLSAGVDVWIQG